jgi:osmotically-inducible protein OsmY
MKNPSWIRRILPRGFVLLAMAGPLYAQSPASAPGQASQQRSAQQIADDVASRIRSFPRYDIFEWIDGTVQDGVVTLSGWSREPWRKEQYASRIASLPGVVAVRNDIEVLPVSIHDEQLRQRAARLVYGNPALQRLGLGVNPPIHIVVNGGRVTLKGVVGSPLERMVAGSAVRGGTLAFQVRNDLTIG